jgi:ATP-dependent Lon protease
VVSLSSPLDSKVRRVFGEVAVNKKLARMSSISRVPAFISEYLLTSRCRDESPSCVEEVARLIAEHHPEPGERERFLGVLKERGELKILDEFRVRVDLRRNMYLLQIPSLQINDALVPESIPRSYERIFSGLWGLGLLRYVPGSSAGEKVGRRSITPVELVDFEPFQSDLVDAKFFAEARSEFTTEEWVDLLVTSVGLNPSAYTFEQKLLLLARLIPLAEPNVNILELGPRATGKTFIYRNLTYYSRIYAGGVVTPARLFFDARLSIPGDLAVNDVVVFDEISRVKFSNSDEIVSKLKDYMVDGFFERGALKRAHSTCSLVFVGNIDLEAVDREVAALDYLPSFMRDTAFLDRIHGFIPGWRLPKILSSDRHLASGYGLASDYLAEVLHRLRGEAFSSLIEEHVELLGHYTIRDERAVRRLASGVVKLVYPSGEVERQTLSRILKLVVGLRNNVVRLLSTMSPSEYPPKELDVAVRA